MTALPTDIAGSSGSQPRKLDDYRRMALMAGAGAAVLMLIGLLVPSQRQQFFRSYLAGYLLWVGITLGCLAVVMLHHLVGGAWGLLVRRIGEAAAVQAPLMAVLFIPIVLGAKYLFPWADAARRASDPILQQRAIFSNLPFWTGRAAFYFIVWTSLSWLLARWSREQDRTGSAAAAERLARLSAPGLVLFFVTGTLMSVDWIMSREPHWYSTVQGFLVTTGQALSGVAFMIAMLSVIVENEGATLLKQVATPGRLNDLGNLLLTLVILWAYMALAQLIVIWMGNTRLDITWYTQRGMDPQHLNAWRFVGIGLVVLHFFVPFFLLLSKDVKRRAATLGAIAGGLLVLRHMDMVWLTAPTVIGAGAEDGIEAVTGGSASWMDLVAPIAIGGIWFAGFARALRSMPLIPLHDAGTPDLMETGEGHEEHQTVSEASSIGTHGAAAAATEGGGHGT